MPTLIDFELVKELFDYNPVSGRLTTKSDRGQGGRIKKGSLVGSLHECGPKNSKKYYLRAMVKDSYVYVHRVIWVIMTGEQPKDIDHIDGNGLNNKWENLRSVSHSDNGKNQRIHKTNTSGISGVSYRKDSDKWRARIMVNDKPINLGTFKNKDDAISARKEAEIKYNFYGGAK